VTDPRIGAFLRLGQTSGKHADSPQWHQIMADTFPKQREFVLHGDVALAGRGGGKSHGHARKFHRRAHSFPGKSSVFVTQSSERSRDILLPALEALSQKYNLGLREYRKANAMVWPNGYRVLFRGCKDRVECNKRRGTPWVEAGWDECDAINSTLLEFDIHECVEPRLIDFDGSWAATGTPGAVPVGYWHQLSKGLTEFPYRIVTWDARDNPHMPGVLTYFAKALKRMGGVPERKSWPVECTELHHLYAPEYVHLLPAKFVREYLGLWVMDLQALIYRILPRNNYSGHMPFEAQRTTIGVDLGGASIIGPNQKLDRTAVAVCQSAENLPTIWVPEAYALTDVTVDGLAQRLCQLIERYPDATVEIDSASAGKIIENTFRKMGIPIRAATKGPKLRRIQLVQSRLQSGHLRIHITKCMDLRTEATSLVWDDDRKKHSERCADDVWDALLMGAYPHFGDTEEEDIPKHEPKPGSKAAIEAEEARELEEAYEEACRQIDDEAA
jgi:hypothetical protein